LQWVISLVGGGAPKLTIHKHMRQNFALGEFSVINVNCEDLAMKTKIIWGVKAIAEEIGRSEKACFHALQQGKIPGARKIAGRWGSGGVRRGLCQRGGVMKKSRSVRRWRAAQTPLKALAEAEHYTVRRELYIRHWKNALLIATTDSEDEQELYARLECYVEEMDAILALVAEDEAAELAKGV
jgi:hypothetical protein